MKRKRVEIKKPTLVTVWAEIYALPEIKTG